MSGSPSPRAWYQDSARRHGESVRHLERVARRVEAARLATFVVGAVVGLLRDELPVTPTIPTLAAALFLSAFFVLVVRHRRLRRRLRRERAALTLARIGLLRLDRDWPGLHHALDDFGYHDPLLDPDAAADEAHPYLHDLDVFGPASLRALLGPTPSATGSETLGRWLLAPAAPDEVRRRQRVVRRLARDADGRDALAIEGLLIERVGSGAWRGFLRWIERGPLFGRAIPRWSIPVARVMPPATVGLFIAWAVGAVSVVAWLLPLGVQAVLAVRWGPVFGSYFEAASSRSPGLRRHHPLFAAWEEYGAREADAAGAGDGAGEPVLAELAGRLSDRSGLRASEEIRSLERWLDAADSHGSMMHQLFGIVLLWDVHVAVGLERWRERAGADVERWFDALGELEALSALATLAFDHPEWSFPELRDGIPGLSAEGLGHPLIPDSERKTSDVALEPPGGFLLVTGSNMSGKSTLLRSLGLAAVLGQAGSVVCATRVELTPLRAFTSMRIHDSLTAGVSLFMAELLRLKALVDAADEAGRDPEGPALLYLIDEVLQGTNSEERRVAARRIITHLLDARAVGAVTTHDLALHEDPRLDAASKKVHFRETVVEGQEEVLTFDYELRPGLATSRNALKLLRIVGLDEATD